MQVKGTFRFGPFLLDGRAYRLTQGGVPIDLPPKALDLLFLLASRPAALVTKDEIFDELWPGVSVTDNAITQVVSDLREALGDAPSKPAFIQTVPRRGYRFVAEVTQIEAGHVAAQVVPGTGPAPAGPVEPRSPGGERLRRLAVSAFTNLSGESSLDWLAAGFAETLTHALRAVPDLAVVDRMPGAEPGGRSVAASLPEPDLVVVGSVQRAGDRLRVMARILDTGSREARAQARADGGLADVFDIQDAIATQLLTGLQVTLSPAAESRIRARETSSLDAYRALTEGRLKLETLDPEAVPGAVADFERALGFDPKYALAHVGLGHAHFWRFQASRAQAQPDVAALRQAVDHARRAIGLDEGLAEAHSALALFLSAADRSLEAVAAGRLAVAIEPTNWRHQFRYGIAAWGAEREAALGRAAELFPPLGFTYFGLAMLAIARGDLTEAERVLDRGLSLEVPEPGGAARLPGNGLHWLRGLVRLARGDTAGARAAFDRELDRASRGLFGREYAMDACVGHAYALTREGDLDGAARMFEAALAQIPSHARSWLGLAEVRFRQGRRADTETALSHGLDAIDGLRALGRTGEAALATATAELLAGRPESAVQVLAKLMEQAPPGYAGWSIPVEPAFAGLSADPGFQAVRARLAERAL